MMKTPTTFFKAAALGLCIAAGAAGTKINAQNSTCPNLNFSMNDFTGWQAYAGIWYSTNQSSIDSCAPISTGGIGKERHTIMDAQQLITSGTLYDEHCLVIKKVPDGFDYAVKLGNHSKGAQMEALEYTMTIDSSNAALILRFAWVMQDPGHVPANQPRFSMLIKDSAGNIMSNLPCGNVQFVSSNLLTNLACTILVDGSSLTLGEARDWTTVGFDLTHLIGQTIKIYFETRDCFEAAHFGYAYFVAECMPFQINLSFCEGDVNAVLEAPIGFVNYKWSRSTQPLWAEQGANKQTIIVTDPAEGEVFTCEAISELDSTCSATLTAIINRTIVTPQFVCDYDTCTRTAVFADSSFVTGGKKAAIQWEIPQLNVFSSDSLFTYTFPNPPTHQIDTYLVRLTVISDNGCEKFEEQTISVYPSPEVQIDGDTICVGSSAYLKAVPLHSEFISHTWTWTDENGTPQTANGDSVNIFHAGIYTLTSVNTQHCTATDTIYINTYPVPSIELIDIKYEYCDEKNGFIEITTHDAEQPVSYFWNTGDTTPRIENLVGNRTYNVEVTDGNNCHADTGFFLGICNTSFDVAKTDEICGNSNGTITLTVTSTHPSTIKYIWDGFSDTTSVLTGLKSGTYNVTVSDTFCVWEGAITIDYIGGPDADFDASLLKASLGEEIQFTDKSVAGDGKITSWYWNFGDSKESYLQNPVHKYFTAGYFTVFMRIEDEFHCQDSAELEVLIVEGLAFPNIFTPIGSDGKQYFFRPLEDAVRFAEFTIDIYNRWGTLVWRNACKAPDCPSYEDAFWWDGSNRQGKLVSNGVYYWVVYASYAPEIKPLVKNGSVTVLSK